MTEQELTGHLRRLESLERELDQLKRQVGKLPTRTTGGGGSGTSGWAADPDPPEEQGWE